MSTGTMQERGQSTDQISQQREQVEHTEPTPEELAAQARITRPFIAVDRNGKAYDCRYVEDGYAFRPYGSTDDAAWQWQRSRDFEGRCEVFHKYNPQPNLDALATVTLETSRLKRQLRTVYAAMGKNSRNRLTSMLNPTDVASIFPVSVSDNDIDINSRSKKDRKRS